MTPEPSPPPAWELIEMATTLGSTALATEPQSIVPLPLACTTGPALVPAGREDDDELVVAVWGPSSAARTPAVVPPATTAATTAASAMSTQRRRGRRSRVVVPVPAGVPNAAPAGDAVEAYGSPHGP